MQATITEGAKSRDFFGLATDTQDDEYRGFSLGHSAAIYLDALLLIEPSAAAAYAARVPPVVMAGADTSGEAGADVATSPAAASNLKDSADSTGGESATRVTRYFGTVERDPVRASLQFSKIVSELVELFSAKPDSNVTIKVDIEARSPGGFDETTVRAARENGRTLDMKTSEFE